MLSLSSVISRVIILVAGVLYPSYCSFKAIQTKDVKEYVRWMIYWIVFSLFVSVETISDQFVTWIPFYYELKISVVLWLVSPASRGSILFYKKHLHPLLSSREKEIDKLISGFTSYGYAVFTKILSYAYSFILSVVNKGHYAFVDQLKKRYNLEERNSEIPTLTEKKNLSETRKTENNKSGKSLLPPTEKPGTELLSKVVELGVTASTPEKPRIPPAAAKKDAITSSATVTPATSPTAKPSPAAAAAAAAPSPSSTSSGTVSSRSPASGHSAKQVMPIYPPNSILATLTTSPPRSTSTSVSSRSSSYASASSTSHAGTGSSTSRDAGSYFDRYVKPSASYYDRSSTSKSTTTRPSTSLSRSTWK